MKTSNHLPFLLMAFFASLILLSHHLLRSRYRHSVLSIINNITYTCKTFHCRQASHELHHIDKAIAAFTKIGKELGVIQ